MRNEVAHYRHLPAWNPWSTFADFRREFDRIFDEFGMQSSPRSDAGSAFMPACDVEETSDHYLLSFDLPGVKKDDIRIEMSDSRLVVSGERRQEIRDGGNGVRFTERRHGHFERAFNLPAGVDADRIEANFQDGVLRVALPKPSSAKPRQVPIQDGRNGVFAKLLGKTETAA